jgi:serine/threonine-protein kinase HipA
VGKDPNLSAL